MFVLKETTHRGTGCLLPGQDRGRQKAHSITVVFYDFFVGEQIAEIVCSYDGKSLACRIHLVHHGSWHASFDI